MGTGRMSVKYRKWTKDDDELLIRMYRDKKTQREIAAEMGRSVSSINGRVKIIRENGIDMREEPVEEAGECYMTRGEIAASYRQAKYQNDQKRILAQLCCMTISEITKILEEEGALQETEKRKQKEKYKSDSRSAYRKGQRYTAKEDAEILKGYREGKKAADIGRPLGRSGLCISARIGMFRRKGMLEKKSPPGRDPDGKKKGNENIVIVSQK